MDTLYRYITLYWILCYLLPASEGSFSTVHESDSGIYGCRVEIRGPFNDKKQNFHLKISKTSKANRRLNQSAITLTTTKSPTPGKSSTLSAWSVESSPQTGQTESVVSSTGHPRQLMTENGTGDQSSSPDPVVILTSLLLVVIVVTVFLVMMRKNQQNNLMKEKAQRGGVSSVFSPNSNPQPLPRETAVDNIYQLEENNTYETCP
ncbi:hypothetical protein MATL_G00173070 [Megalops atlanticus]|uniref:Uncharacterized protein n=1 Tax=Megalops atlanticus TaxID=7932 RepID=A0A9D3T7B6_MEGAT|nr:hypothetical protein MATL_G00173070 [Megalops atlanticus]